MDDGEKKKMAERKTGLVAQENDSEPEESNESKARKKKHWAKMFNQKN